jgi:hypothetical protein
LVRRKILNRHVRIVIPAGSIIFGTARCLVMFVSIGRMINCGVLLESQTGSGKWFFSRCGGSLLCLVMI